MIISRSVTLLQMVLFHLLLLILHKHIFIRSSVDGHLSCFHVQGCYEHWGVCIFSFFLMEVELIYNVVLVSNVQQNDSFFRFRFVPFMAYY